MQRSLTEKSDARHALYACYREQIYGQRRTDAGTYLRKDFQVDSTGTLHSISHAR